MAHSSGSRWTCAAIAATLFISACGKEEGAPAPAAAPTAAPATEASVPPATPPPAVAPPAATGNWTPEALEQLLAPIAIYPDVVLGHVLTASTNPQEVLDAGNWLVAHQDLKGDQIDAEAQKLGLSTSVRALLQFPETMDMMCMKLDWTTQLGQAFTQDQAAVLDAVQRLRQQAKDVGNLQSSAQLAVETEQQDDKEVVTVKPANPDVVYVPKYDPVAVYAPPPATIPPPTTVNVQAAPGTTVTTTTGATTTTATTAPATTTTEDKGHSTGSLITTGLLAFGAGILVNEVFDDDDDWDNYGPNYYGGGMYYGGHPYYPPPPYMYRPPYGNGYYPSNGYNRPPNYQHGFNNNTIIVNNGGNNYWNDFNRTSQPIGQTRAKSPITAARPNRPELQALNQGASDRASNRSRAASQGGSISTPANRPAQGQYVGNTAAGRAERDRMVQNSAKPSAGTAAARPQGVARDMPARPQGTYAGAANRPSASATGKPGGAKPAARTASQPREQRPTGTTDRGRTASREAGAAPRPERTTPSNRPENAQRPKPASRPTSPTPGAGPSSRPARDKSAFDSGGRGASQERAASQRGQASKPSGARGGGHRSRN